MPHPLGQLVDRMSDGIDPHGQLGRLRPLRRQEPRSVIRSGQRSVVDRQPL
jgi:hypothetical protein